MDERALEYLIENEKEWRKYLVKKIDAVEEEQSKQGKAIVKLKVKASIWGFLSGSIPAAVLLALNFFKSKM